MSTSGEDPDRFARRQSWEQTPRPGSWRVPTRSQAARLVATAVPLLAGLVLLTGEPEVAAAVSGVLLVQLFVQPAPDPTDPGAAARRQRWQGLVSAAAWVTGAAAVLAVTLHLWPWSAGVRVPAAALTAVSGLAAGAVRSLLAARRLRRPARPAR